ncbi:MAG: ATP-dependent zinc protease [Campylobacterota bacterium]
MQNIIVLSVAIFLLVTFSGCSDFMKLQTQNQQIKEQLLHLQQQNDAVKSSCDASIDAYEKNQRSIQDQLTKHTKILLELEKDRALDKQMQYLKSAMKDLKEAFSRIHSEDSSKKQNEQQLTNPFSRNIESDKNIIGEVEKIMIRPLDIVVDVRVDTGASTSSLSAQNITKFEKDSKDWVAFDFTVDDEVYTIESPIQREAKIRQSSTKDLITRYVVAIEIELADMVQTIEFTLADRTHLSYPVLLGRNFLQDLWIVDISKKYSLKTKKKSDEE